MKKTQLDRTMSGLREGLFAVFQDVMNGDHSPNVGIACSSLGKVIVESVKVQMQYEQMRLESKVPSHLPDMKLLPPLGK